MKKLKIDFDTTVCPVCKSDWRGPEIREADRYMFGGKTHYSRRIGVYDRDLDETVAWECPDCKHRFRREQ